MKAFLKLITPLFLFTLGWAPASVAQPGPKKKEQIEALRMGFLTQKLDLTGKEAQQFWPVYNEYQDKLEALRKTRKKELRAEPGTLDQITDQEAEQIIDAELQLKAKEVELNKTYFEKFKQVLPIKKVLKLMRAEEEFKRELLKQLKDKN
jgi:Spy/CpxP family protein refolding chaperone